MFPPLPPPSAAPAQTFSCHPPCALPEEDLPQRPRGPRGRLRPRLWAAAPEALELMELGRGPVFTFPLAEEAQDERAAERAQTHTVHVHVRLTDMPFFF